MKTRKLLTEKVLKHRQPGRRLRFESRIFLMPTPIFSTRARPRPVGTSASGRWSSRRRRSANHGRPSFPAHPYYGDFKIKTVKSFITLCPGSVS
jgi:hypothetical protein